MALIDEDGNLFGAVNVIDALVVVLLLAVGVAGVAAVGVLSGDTEQGTKYATIDLGEQPDYVVNQIEAGDEMSPDGFDQNLTVTDVYVTTAAPNNGSDARVTVRGEIEGELIDVGDRDDPVFEFAGERLRVGDTLEIDTPDYGTSGQVTALAESNETLDVESEPVLLESTMSAAAANEIAAGDTFELGPYTVATVETVRTYPAGDDQYRVHLGVELETLRNGGSLTFAGQSLTVGSQVALTSDAYAFSGEVIQRGATAIESEPATRHATIDFSAQPDYIIDRIEDGDTMTVGDESITITDVHVSPSDGDDGHVVVRAAIDGQLVERPGQPDPVYWFAGEHLRVGDEFEFDIGDYAASGSVTSLDAEDDVLATGQTSVLLESTVSTATANEIAAGDTFEVGPHTVATVETVQTYPLGDDSYRVHLGAELDTLERGSATLFAGNPVTVDRTLSLNTGSYDLDGEVIRTGTLEPAGEEATRSVEVKLENVDPDIAAGLEPGMTETERGETLATIGAIDTQAAEIVLESEDGNIYLREHPTNKDVRLTVDLQVRETDSGLEFHGESLREGESIALDLGTKLLEPTVVDVDP